MKKYKRIFTVVIDSLGAGAMPDASEYGDAGTDTLGHISQSVDGFNIPNLQRLGIANLHPLKQVDAAEKPLGYYTYLYEASTGKDTMTGHWEMMGLRTTAPFRTFTETGFPEELLKELSQRTGRGIIGNKAASGTAILDELAPRQLETGELIVYTSADSVLQICGSEETMGLAELYRCCEIARALTLEEPWKVGRVIARPYVGKAPGQFKRTANRHDYAVPPFGPTVLDALKEAGLEVISVGKISDIFAGQGITKSHHSESSVHGMEQAITIAQEDFHGLCFVNLVDFDMLYGHRRDVDGYAKALAEFDGWLPGFLEKLGEEDLVLITADHGCDPAYTATTDHTREYVPLLALGKKVRPVNLGTRRGFADIAATIAELLEVKLDTPGKSFAGEIL